MTEFDELALTRLRRSYRLMTALLCAVPSAYLVAAFGNGRLASVLILMIMVALVILFSKIRAYPCPRCGKPFGQAETYDARFPGRKCVHCELPLDP